MKGGLKKLPSKPKLKHKDTQKKISQNKYSSWLVKLLPFLAILVAALVFFYPVWLQNKIAFPADFVVGAYYPWLDYQWGYPTGVPVKNPITTDVPSFMYPMQMLGIDLFKSGQLPLWNPYILAGSPLLANFQSAPFSPTNFVYFLINRLDAWSLQIILQHILAATFTYLLLRHWKVSKIGAVFGGIIFAFSGFNLLWSQWNGHALSAAFIPAILLFTDRFLRRANFLDGFLLSIAVAAQNLSGYPQVVFYTLIAVFVLWLFRVREVSNIVWKTIFLGIYGVLGLGLTSFQLLPGSELLSLSQREVEPHPFEWAFLPWVKVITFFAPDYFGNHSTQNYWGPQDYTSNTGFVGIIPFIFAMFGISQLKNKVVKIALSIGVLSLLLSFPTPLSIFLWKSGLFGLQAASAHRALVLFNLSIAILAGFGADYFLANKKLPVLRSVLPGLLVVGGFAIVCLYLFKTSRANPDELNAFVRGIDKYYVGLRNLVIPSGVLLLTITTLFVSTKLFQFKKLILFGLIALSCFELFRFGWKFNPFSDKHIVYPTTPVLEFIQSQEKPFRTTGNRVIPINMRMPYKIETVEGYDAVYPLRISQFLAAINGNKSGTDPLGRYGTVDYDTAPILDLVNTKYYLIKKTDKDFKPLPLGEIPENYDLKDRYTIAFEDRSVAVLESKKTLPRAHMFYQWEKENNNNKILDKMIDPNFNFSKVLLVENDFSTIPNDKGEGIVKYEKYTEQESIVNVSTNSPGLLFISDVYYPGWKAEIDGSPTSIYRADFAFRAIEVPKGDHKIKMFYQPDSFKNGLFITIGSLCLLVIMPLLLKVVGKRKANLYT